MAHCFRPHAPASCRVTARVTTCIKHCPITLRITPLQGRAPDCVCVCRRLNYHLYGPCADHRQNLWYGRRVGKEPQRTWHHQSDAVRRTEVLHERAEDTPTSLKSAQPSKAIRASTSLADGMLSMAPSTSTAIAEATEARCMMALIRSDVSESDSCKLMSPATK